MQTEYIDKQIFVEHIISQLTRGGRHLALPFRIYWTRNLRADDR